MTGKIFFLPSPIFFLTALVVFSERDYNFSNVGENRLDSVAMCVSERENFNRSRGMIKLAKLLKLFLIF